LISSSGSPQGLVGGVAAGRDAHGGGKGPIKSTNTFLAGESLDGIIGSVHNQSILSTEKQRVEVGGTAPGGYTQSGTQYTPPGFPPTANEHILRLRGYVPATTAAGNTVWLMQAAEATDVEQGRGGSGGQKRKASAQVAENVQAATVPRVGDREQEDQDMEDVSEESSSLSSGSGSGIPSNTLASEDKKDGEQTVVHPTKSEDVEMGEAPVTTQSAEASQPTTRHEKTATPSSLTGSITAPLSPSGLRRRPESSAATSGWKVLPRDYMKCSPADMGTVISDMLMELIAINDEMPPKNELTRFHSRYVTCSSPLSANN
jgi:hypothetical protein